MDALIPNNRGLVAGPPVFENIIDALTYWEQKSDELFDEYGDAVEVEDFVAWAIREGCPAMVAFIALRNGDEPETAFDALRTICISNHGYEEAARFFSDFLKVDIATEDAEVKRSAFSTGAQRRDEVIKPHVWEAPPNVVDVYFKISSEVVAGAYGPDEYDLAIDVLRSAEGSPCNEAYGEAMRYRGIGEVLEAKGDRAGAIEAYETAISLYPHVGVKRRLKALLQQRNAPQEIGVRN